MASLKPGCVVRCLRCGYEGQSLLMKCPRCGGPLITICDRKRWSVRPNEASMWRYSDLMSISFDRVVSYGEGYTPIIRFNGIYLKLETRNPSGSYGDRAASAVASSFSPGSSYSVSYSEDFASSMAFYARLSGERVTVIADPAEIDTIDAIFLAKYGAQLDYHGPPDVPYESPLTYEALKTIAYEVVEKGLRPRRVLVPTHAGFLALSTINGFREASYTLGLRTPEVIPVTIKGSTQWLRSLVNLNLRIVEVEPAEVMRALVMLATRGLYVRPLAAAAFAVADQGDLVIVTGGVRKQPRLRVRASTLKDAIVRLLSNGSPRTAYEIWNSLGGAFTLRGVYGTLRNLEDSGAVCVSFSMKGSRKVKLYTLCNNGLRQ